MRLRKPTPSMAVAMTALGVSLGGTSYAAVKITSKDVKNNSLTGVDIKNRSLASKDFKRGSLPAGADGGTGPQGARGEQGPTGPAGAKGEPGAPGAPGDKGGKGDKGDAGIGRWVLVNANGAIEAQSGGFEIRSAYNRADNANPAPAGAIANVYIDANEDLTDNGIVATVALQNQVEQGGDPALKNGLAAGADANPEFSGEITATRCAIAGVVACAPIGADTNEHFVVSPRNSDGSPTVAAGSGPTDTTTIEGRKRFYVILTGDSTDFVAP